jgi:hypothetical protein
MLVDVPHINTRYWRITADTAGLGELVEGMGVQQGVEASVLLPSYLILLTYCMLDSKFNPHLIIPLEAARKTNNVIKHLYPYILAISYPPGSTILMLPILNV